jgi:hypothetical protein
MSLLVSEESCGCWIELRNGEHVQHKCEEHKLRPVDANAQRLRAALELTGAGMMALTTEIGDGHSWVRDAFAGVAVWCQWCGLHRSQVSDWKDNPQCPAIVAIRGLAP